MSIIPRTELGEILKSYEPRLRTIARRLLGRGRSFDGDLVNEVVGELYLHLLKSVNNFEAAGREDLYIFGIKMAVLNTMRYVRKLRNRGVIVPQRKLKETTLRVDLMVISDLQDSGCTYTLEPAIEDENLKEFEFSDLLETVEKKLPKSYSRVIRMFYFEGKSCAEIARKFSITRQAVAQRINLSLFKLKQVLKDPE